MFILLRDIINKKYIESIYYDIDRDIISIYIETPKIQYSYQDRINPELIDENFTIALSNEILSSKDITVMAEFLKPYQKFIRCEEIGKINKNSKCVILYGGNKS